MDDSAYRHDICYAQNRDAKTRNEVCDKKMLAELKDINNPRGREKVDKALVQKIIGTKVRFGWGLKKNSRWTDALAEELHKPVTRKFEKRRVIARGVDNIWAADLVDMKAFAKDNEGVKYLLTVLDVFSKYGWILPLKTKTGVEVANALRHIFKERKPEKLWVDKGKEFYNKDVKSLIRYLFHRKRREG